MTWAIVARLSYPRGRGGTLAGTTFVRARIDEDLKNEAAVVLAELGLTVSDAVRMMLTRVAKDRALPLDMKVPNAATRAAMEEARAMMATRQVGFTDPQALFDALDRDARKDKRASLPRSVDVTEASIEGRDRLSRSRRYDMRQRKDAMMSLMADDAPLGPEWLDHALKGDWADHRECHIGGDLLLIYRIEGHLISFVRTGTHAQLFE